MYQRALDNTVTVFRLSVCNADVADLDDTSATALMSGNASICGCRAVIVKQCTICSAGPLGDESLVVRLRMFVCALLLACKL